MLSTSLSRMHARASSFSSALARINLWPRFVVSYSYLIYDLSMQKSDRSLGRLQRFVEHEVSSSGVAPSSSVSERRRRTWAGWTAQ